MAHFFLSVFTKNILMNPNTQWKNNHELRVHYKNVSTKIKRIQHFVNRKKWTSHINSGSSTTMVRRTTFGDMKFSKKWIKLGLGLQYKNTRKKTETGNWDPIWLILEKWVFSITKFTDGTLPVEIIPKRERKTGDQNISWQLVSTLNAVSPKNVPNFWSVNQYEIPKIFF